jgi:hypothetical protein
VKNFKFPFQSGLWLILGLIASALAIVGLVFNGPTVFLRAYLFSYLFWLGITLGCLAIVMISYLTQSSWGYISRWILEAGAKTIWLMVILFIPVALGMMQLYGWAVPANVQANPLLAHKSPYLNIPFFLIRAAIYFAVWILFTQMLSHMAAQPDTYSNLEKQRTFRTLSAIGLIVYFLTMSFASIDWMMSLTPDWFSTIFGMLVVLGQALSAFAFVLLVLPRLAESEPLFSVITTRNVQDLGGLLLTVVMTWAYLAFSQLLIIWAGNIPEEVLWYYDRSAGGWLLVGALIAVFQFALPFVLLISTRVRQSSSWLASLGLLILVMRLIDNFWMVMPAFSPRKFSFHWLDVVVPLAIGGLWMATFAWFVRRAPFFIPEKMMVHANVHTKTSTNS